MKKLMMAAAIVCAAVAAQAATVNWNQQNYTAMPGGESFAANGLDVYMIRTADHSLSSLMTAYVAAGSVSAFTSTLDSWKAIATTTTGGDMGTFTVNGGSSDAFKNGASEYAYYVVADASGLFVSDSEVTAYNGLDGSYSFDFSEASAEASVNPALDAKDGWAGAGWYTATTATPEPTSGLLLLIGMAGLALRRRRA